MPFPCEANTGNQIQYITYILLLFREKSNKHKQNIYIYTQYVLRYS